MKLRSLIIGKLPGIAHRIEVTGFSEGVNFITGPNASGKTSLIRALGYLLSPQQKNDPADLILEAEFDIDGTRWGVTRTGGDPVWREMGQEAPRPNLPTQDLLDCHLIRIEDLIALGQGNDQVLAETLQREMDGGLDLRTTRQRMTKQVDAKALHQSRSVTAAREQLNQIRNEHRALAAQQKKLPELEQAIASAKKSQRELQAIDWAMKAIKHQQTIAALAAEKAALPDTLATLTGQEIEQIETLEQEQRKLKETLAVTQQSLQKLGKGLAATGMAANIPEDVLVQEISKHLETIRAIDQSIAAESKQLAQWQIQSQKALERLGVASDQERSDWPKLSVSDIDQAQTLARKIDRAHQMAQQAPSNKAAQSSNERRWLPALLLASSGLAVAGLFLDQPLLAVASVLALTGLSLWRVLAPQNGTQSINEGTEQSIGVLEAQAQALAEQLGFEPALLSENASLVFADAYRQYQVAMDGLSASEQAIAHNRSQLEETRLQLAERLGKVDASLSNAIRETKNTTTLQAIIEDWLGRAEHAHAIRKELDELEHTQTELLNALKDHQTSIAAIYHSAKLPVDAKDSLKDHLGKRSLWQDIESKIATEQALLDDRMGQLGAFPHLATLVETNDQVTLESALLKHQTASEELESLQEKHIRLQQAIELASTGDGLTKATGELDRAMDELNSKRAQALKAKAGLFWLDAINEQTREASGDRTFDQAKALFLTFTHHQWELGLEDTFVARRTSDQAPVRLSQLSTATRMQLLLAVRMARVLKAEANQYALPLFIDEALTTSDPQRAAAIIENLQTIALEQNRQIIYLAASDYELQLWCHLTDKHPTRIELGQPSGSDDASQPRLSFEPDALIPPPNGQSPTEYANTLGVATLSAFTPVDDLPLFYLVGDDVELTHELMSIWRLATLGPFERWLQNGPAKTHLDATQIAAFKRRCQITKRWWSAWHEGQVKPLTEGLMHKALDGGGLTETTLEGVIKAAELVGFNGPQLLRHLEAHPIEMANTNRRISGRQLNLFREFLETEGYLPTGSALSREQCRLRALERLPKDISTTELQELAALIDRLEIGTEKDERTGLTGDH